MLEVMIDPTNFEISTLTIHIVSSDDLGVEKRSRHCWNVAIVVAANIIASIQL